MRVLAAFLVVAFAVSAWAQEKATPTRDPEVVKTVSRVEFNDELRAIEKLAAPTFQKRDMRGRLAKTRLIHREGRVVDVKPCERDGQRTVCIDVRVLASAGEIASFVPTSDEAPLAIAWNKGDGIGWMERPVVAPDGGIDFERIFTKLADLIHVSNADPDAERSGGPPATGGPTGGSTAGDRIKSSRAGNREMPPTKNPIAYGSTFRLWLKLFVGACRAADVDAAQHVEDSVIEYDWRRAWLVYCVGDLGWKTWVFDARVVEIEKGSVTIGFNDLKPYWADWQKDAREWGVGQTIDAGGYLTRRVEVPPKVAGTLTVGDDIQVALDVTAFTSMEEMRAANGRFQSTVALRIPVAARRDPPPAPGPSVAPSPDAPPPIAVRKLEKPVGGPSDYLAWLKRFITARFHEDDALAQTIWAEGASKTWVFPATVDAKSDTEVVVRLTSDAYLDELTRRQRWGIGPEGRAVAVADPQLRAALSVGTRVKVTIDLDPEGAGTFLAQIAVWKIVSK